MGERYDGWVTDEVAGPFLKENGIDRLSLPVANALEVMVDPTPVTGRQYNITRRGAKKTVLESTGWKTIKLRIFIHDLQDHTIYRFQKKGEF